MRPQAFAYVCRITLLALGTAAFLPTPALAWMSFKERKENRRQNCAQALAFLDAATRSNNFAPLANIRDRFESGDLSYWQMRAVYRTMKPFTLEPEKYGLLEHQLKERLLKFIELRDPTFPWYKAVLRKLGRAVPDMIDWKDQRTQRKILDLMAMHLASKNAFEALKEFGFEPSKKFRHLLAKELLIKRPWVRLSVADMAQLSGLNALLMGQGFYFPFFLPTPASALEVGRITPELWETLLRDGLDAHKDDVLALYFADHKMTHTTWPAVRMAYLITIGSLLNDFYEQKNETERQQQTMEIQQKLLATYCRSVDSNPSPEERLEKWIPKETLRLGRPPSAINIEGMRLFFKSEDSQTFEFLVMQQQILDVYGKLPDCASVAGDSGKKITTQDLE